MDITLLMDNAVVLCARAGGRIAWHYNDGATDEAIASAEQTLNLSLPPEFRQLYAWHDGTEEYDDQTGRAPLVLPVNCFWWSLERLTARWEDQVRLFDQIGFETGDVISASAKIKTDLSYRSGWIPFGGSISNVILYIDMDPGPAGTVGQIIMYDNVDPPVWISESLQQYLQHFAFCVNEKLVVAKDGGWFDAKSGQAVSDLWVVTGTDWKP